MATKTIFETSWTVTSESENTSKERPQTSLTKVEN